MLQRILPEGFSLLYIKIYSSCKI